MSKQPNYVFDDELYHHGIQGQKWGERRFQNEDGSWTAEGRERYGKGDDERAKAKAAFKTEKYKMYLKSKEEKHRIKLQMKNERFARKEMAKLNKQQEKFDKKKDDVSLKNKLNRTRKYAMNDDELKNAVDRLKLEAEYNKNYVLATSKSKALIKADRFFEGPTGKAFTQIAANTIPNVANTIVSKLMDKAVNKDPNDLSKKKQIADIKSTEATARKTNADAASTEYKLKQAKNGAVDPKEYHRKVMERYRRMYKIKKK